MLTRAHYYTLS